MRASTPIASFLLLKGVELDRIWLRPWSKGDGYAASKYVTLDGRPWRLGRRRIGILSPYFPWPLSHGGAVRIYHLLREAAKEFDIVLYSFGAVEQDSPIMDLVARAYLFELPRYRRPRWASLLPLLPTSSDVISATCTRGCTPWRLSRAKCRMECAEVGEAGRSCT